MEVCFRITVGTLLNAGQNYCRILSTFIKLPFIIKIFVFSIFEWPFYTGFNVYICPEYVVCFLSLLHFRLDFLMEANNMIPYQEQSDLGPYCLQFTCRLSKNIQWSS